MRPFSLFSLLFVLTLLASPAHGDEFWIHAEKDAAEATWSAPEPYDEAGLLAASGTDIELDWKHPYWPTGASLDEAPLAVRRYVQLTSISPPRFATFTYVLLRQKRSDGYYDALALKLDADGNPVTSFGGNGFKRLATKLDTIDAATFGPGGEVGGPTQVFFAGSKYSGTASLLDWDMAVACFDLGKADGFCSGWPTGSIRTIAFDFGGLQADIANTIEYDPAGFLFAGGKVSRADRAVVGVTKLNAATGNLVASFGAGADGRAWYSFNGNPYDPNIIASAFAPASTSGGKRLYIAGSHQPGTDTTDRDGFILSIDPDTGSANRRDIFYELDNEGWKKDEITAITVLANGKVAYAGWSDTDDPLYPSLLIGRLAARTLTTDPNFCGGTICGHAQTNFITGGTRNIRPHAIAERPLTRDLVLALSGSRRDGIFGGTGPFYSRQLLQLWSSSGRRLRTSVQNGYSSDPGVNPASWAGPIAVTDSDVLLAGIRLWNSGDNDVTVSRHLRMDSIFANQFGNTTSD